MNTKRTFWYKGKRVTATLISVNKCNDDTIVSIEFEYLKVSNVFKLKKPKRVKFREKFAGLIFWRSLNDLARVQNIDLIEFLWGAHEYHQIL